MTKTELIKILEQYDENEKIGFTLECDNEYRYIDYVEKRGNAGIILFCKDIPDSDALHSMIDACLDKNNNLTRKQEEILKEYIHES